MLLSDVLEFEDEYTAQHSRSVVDLVNAVADELGIAPDERQELEFAAMLHDVGKISIPKEILHKPAALTAQEFEVIRHHTIEGQFMLDRVGGLLGRVGEVVRSCHERWDGFGYPDGLSGEEIPIAARIVFACDAYNAMTTDRPYRQAMSREAAVAELVANTGAQFDPKIVDALTTVVKTGNLPQSRASRGSVPSWPGPRFRIVPAQPRVSPRRAAVAGARLPGVAQGDAREGPHHQRPRARNQEDRPDTQGFDESSSSEERCERPGAQPIRTPNVRAIRLSLTVVWMSRRS